RSRIAPPPVRRVGAGAVGGEMQYSVASIAGTLAPSAMPSDACVSVPAPQRGDRGALPLDYSLDGRASWPFSWSDGSRSIASWSSGISRVIDAFCCPSSVLLVFICDRRTRRAAIAGFDDLRARGSLCNRRY